MKRNNFKNVMVLSEHSKIWARWLVTLALGLNVTPAVADLALGYNALGSWNVTLDAPPGSENGGSYYMDPAAFGVGVTADGQAPSSTRCSAAMYKMTTLDGYSGYLLRPGVLLVLTGTVTGNYSSNYSSYTSATGSWDTKGNYSQTPFLPYIAGSSCSGIDQSKTPSTPNLSLGGYKSTINVSYGIYVSKEAEAGAVTKTYITLIKGSYHSGFRRSVSQLVSPPPVIATNCTISSPSTIAFGDVVQPSSNGVKQPTTVNVSCQAGSNSPIPVSISFRGGTIGDDLYTLPLSTASETVSGDIRGYLGDNAEADAGCSQQSSSVRMDGVSTPIGTVQPGTPLNTPLIWVLCPRQNAQPGQASAKTTIDVNW